MVELKTYPESVRHPEKTGEPQACVHRDGPLALDNLPDAALGDADLLGEAVLRWAWTCPFSYK